MAELCYNEVMTDKGWSLGIVKDGEAGYYATDYPSVDTMKKAQEWARTLNERLGVDEKEQQRLVIQSMRLQNEQERARKKVRRGY